LEPVRDWDRDRDPDVALDVTSTDGLVVTDTEAFDREPEERVLLVRDEGHVLEVRDDRDECLEGCCEDVRDCLEEDASDGR